MINGKQSVKLKSGSISFKNYFKQISVPFKIYADFECLLKGVKSNDKKIVHSQKKCQDHISQKVVLYRGKGLLRQFLKSMIIAKKCIKKAF